MNLIVTLVIFTITVTSVISTPEKLMLELPDPCILSPCGPFSKCKNIEGSPLCSCLPNYIGSPPNCKECITNSECSSSLACIQGKCRDPCEGTCGTGATCNIINHTPICKCPDGYGGDPFTRCTQKIPTSDPKVADPCDPSPCGPNTKCIDGNCSCLPEYHGNPSSGCTPECVLNSDCNKTQACIKSKCKDPCAGICGENSNCTVINHGPICSCINGYKGNPLILCSPILDTEKSSQCNPSPCGSNSQCSEINSRVICSCIPGFIGSPPTCHPECVTSSECPLNEACINQKCINLCLGTCGIGAKCQAVNHNPVCSCPPRYTGDPFVRCVIAEVAPMAEQQTPCQPSPCGPNAECKVVNGSSVCSCLPDYTGIPPYCRPECVGSQECANHFACIKQKCKDPCSGTCGENTECRVISHTPNCVCITGFVGDPFTQCILPQAESIQNISRPCYPSPCGSNSMCTEQNGTGVCTCLPDYYGNPYFGCRPECVLNSECSSTRACITNKCKDPCPGTCGENANCQVVNHIPSCSCRPGYTGDPFRYCRVPEMRDVNEPKNICEPSPCGPNSHCRELNGQVICSCLPEYVGSPPACKPECTVSSDCSVNRACINQKCIDPCPGTCGVNARCIVANHGPLCSCQSGYNGNPFTSCYPVLPAVQNPQMAKNPCVPTPCGEFSQCRDMGGAPICSCLANYVGSPPNCRPECVINPECPRYLACIMEKCTDPCPGSCGTNAQCSVINHTPICTCEAGYTGDPFNDCYRKPPPLSGRGYADPCNPSPCGPNSQCKDGLCTCVLGYQGNPNIGCKHECVRNNDCNKTRACVRNNCKDPCVGTCGVNARCKVVNHNPICSCITNHTGDPFTICNPVSLQEASPKMENPCIPSPCGPFSKCARGNVTLCSCLASYIGKPPNCHPECTNNSECSRNLACIAESCINPCDGLCGANTQCSVINHSPICKCLDGYTGNPFSQCFPKPQDEVDPCKLRFCGYNTKCINGTCTCLADHYKDEVGGCRPECILNNECDSKLACMGNKCIDPCLDSCSRNNSRCEVRSHEAKCSCLPEFVGNPYMLCRKVKAIHQRTPCNPSKCGPYSQCREVNGQPDCSCATGYIGIAPSCKPECLSSSECLLTQDCVNQKCVDPCSGTCGIGAQCHVIRHRPKCSCPPDYEGDPFLECKKHGNGPTTICHPSPCGLNSQCREIGNTSLCSCLSNYTGSPPNCRPECRRNYDCPKQLACINNKCKDPCIGTCGSNTQCRVLSHTPFCVCIAGYVGDPFTKCLPQSNAVAEENATACNPSHCGANTKCIIHFEAATCTCLADYIGDPYDGCRPECTRNSDCPSNKACTAGKCKDPCLTNCRNDKDCQVINHQPTCKLEVQLKTSAAPQIVPYIKLMLIVNIFIYVREL